MNTVKDIAADIQNKKIAPIYFLMGEEGYYIDKIADLVGNSVLTEEEKGFNQMVLYGGDVNIDSIISKAKRFPMMADYQVIIVREAQLLSRSIENLGAYIENMQPTTILVMCYKYKTLDKRKKLAKLIAKKGVLFESKKLYDNQVPDWIRRVLAGKQYKIEDKASLMLTEFLGTNLSKISNELDKLMAILPAGTSITAADIEQNIGISKDYNIFELRDAIGLKDVLKANKIINHFAQNPKSNPLVVTISLLFSYFTQLLQYHALPNKSRENVAKALKINPFFVSKYSTAGRNYPMRKVSQIIGYLHDADVKSKGVGAQALPDGAILKELLFKILH
ncbi:MAG: DNA polymerase III subunit delta [Flavobacteriaceae bacterium]|nr:DNA polymerase III subunit delta [Flavobacteriaceae bacterium]